MIRFTLACSDGHRFDSWFASGAAFDKLAKAGALSCTVCGATAVTKAPMAPAVATSETAAPPQPKAQSKEGPLSRPGSEVEKALAELRRKVEENSDYVGLSFASEARKMHEGETPHRPIWGEAKLGEAKALLEDGIPVAPLPFRPKRSTN